MKQSFSFASIAAELEEQIYGNRPVHLSASWADEALYPHYQGLSIANLSQSILRFGGVDVDAPLYDQVWGGELDQGDVERVVLFLSDGMGYRLLQEMMAEDPLVYALVKRITNEHGPLPLTSTVPSSTTTALPTLWTGVYPGQHGMVGTMLYLREMSMIFNMLTFSPMVGVHQPATLEAWGKPISDFVPVPGLAQRLAAAGVSTHLVLAKELVGTGLSKVLHRGVERHHITTGLSDSWYRLHEVLEETRGQRAFVMMYLPNVDLMSHLFGQRSIPVKREIRSQLQMLAELLEDRSVQDGKTLTMMVADHGHVNTHHALDLDRDEAACDLRNSLSMTYAGDSSLSQLFLRDGAREKVSQLFAERFGEYWTLVEPNELVANGVFGPQPHHSDLLNRLGDLTVISRKGARLADWSRAYKPDRIKSWHGGLSEFEMLVPLLWRRI